MADTIDYKQKVTDMLGKAKLGMMTTVAADSKLVSRPMGLQQVEFDGDLWFFTYEGSNKIQQISANPNVNVSISENSNDWLSLAGVAEVVHDHQKAEELWNPFLKAWFEDGVDTEGLTLIKIHAESAEYWDSINSKVIQLFGMAKAVVTGKPAQGGDNESVDL